MNVLFLGCKPVGERCFDLLLEHPRVNILAAVTNVEVGWWGSARIAQRCEELAIPVIANSSRAESELCTFSPDVLLSVQHPWILPETLLTQPSFNLHNAPLPDLKGHNCSNHAILDGMKEYASTIHWMRAEPDAAVIAFEERFAIEATETALSLHCKAVEAGVRVFGRLLECLSANALPPRDERHGAGVFHARDSLDSQREITNLDDISRKARALYFPPFEGAFIRLGGQKFHVIPEVNK